MVEGKERLRAAPFLGEAPNTLESEGANKEVGHLSVILSAKFLILHHFPISYL